MSDEPNNLDRARVSGGGERPGHCLWRLIGLSPVLHTLTLAAPSNCILTGVNPQKIVVVLGKIRPVTFWAKCQ
jgi:hypothetical protein